MNLGLKKPRKKPGDPKPYTQPRALKKASKAEPSSYLPEEKPVKAGKPRARRAGKAPSSSKLF